MQGNFQIKSHSFGTKKGPFQIQIAEYESREHGSFEIYRTILHTLLFPKCSFQFITLISYDFLYISTKHAFCYVLPPHPPKLTSAITHSPLLSAGLIQLYLLMATTPCSLCFHTFSLLPHKTKPLPTCLTESLMTSTQSIGKHKYRQLKYTA